MVLLSPGLVLVLYRMSLLPAHGTIADPEVWVHAAIGVLLIAAFVIHAMRWADRALVDLRLFKSREVAAANAVRFLFAITFFGSFLLLLA